MATITISGVDPALKRRFQIACVKAQTDMSAVLRARLEEIIRDVEGFAEVRERRIEQIRRNVQLEEGEHA